MNKYQNKINPAHQAKYPNKKPAHLKKNPVSHQAWLNSKKARNQAQYFKRDPLAIRCLVCYAAKFKSPLTNWIEEKHYQDSFNIAKVIFTDPNNPLNNAATDGKQYIKSVYYCSFKCFNFQAIQAEREGGNQ